MDSQQPQKISQVRQAKQTLSRKRKIKRSSREIPPVILKTRHRPKKTTLRKLMENAYQKALADIPTMVKCPRCGRTMPRDRTERHHPALRRRTSYLFTIQVCPDCHKWIHNGDPEAAEREGLLWPGRNSKTFGLEDAIGLIAMMRYPSHYPIDVYLKHNPSQCRKNNNNTQQ